MRAPGALFAAAWVVAAGSASAADLRIFPVAGVYGLPADPCAPGGAQDAARVAEDLCGTLDATLRRALGERFAAQVRAAFPGVVSGVAEQIEAGETAEGRLSKTIIASLQVSRVDLWRVEKPATYDVYVPITLSLFLTNALSGEVLFVENHNVIVQGAVTKANLLDQVRSQLPGQLAAAVDQLVTNAAGKFKPYPVSGRIREKVGARYVFDVGRKGGLREGDTLGADARVVFSDATYAIVEPVLQHLSVGQTLARQVAQPVEMLEKPSALVVVGSHPPDLSRGYVNAVFADALGAGAGLAVSPVNPSFTALRAFALGEARLDSRMQDRRRLPDYFVRVSVAALEPVEIATNIQGTRRRVFGARAFVEVVDHNGRVIYATQAADRIVDDVVDDMALSREQRRDTAVKNALTRAATQLSAGFRPARLRLDVRPAGDEVEIDDPGGALGVGVNAVLLRRSGGVAGVQGQVWTPVGEVEVTSVSGTSVRGRLAGLEDVRVRPGDQVAFDSGAGESVSRQRFAVCTSASGETAVSRRGQVEQPLYAQIAINSFAAGFKGPVYLSGFERELRPSLAQFEGAERLGALQARNADVCFAPVHQVDAQGEKAAASGFVTPLYSVALGYTLQRGDEKLGGSGLQSTLAGSGVPAGADTPLKLRAVQFDLADEAAKLTGQVARGLKPPQ
ncbi:hypothetical protein [Phenylobacterium sp.]|uniref:hypothetical protein n=1 Tax=Phenylobacterium sp. TaxID=1871053 RepID=UPI0035B2C7EA